MSSKRVWAVRGRYVGQKWAAESFSVEHDSVESALEDVEYLWDAGFGSSMRSYVVPA
jgi:hypothetical protein